MDDPARRELAERQARLLRSLAGTAPPPEGFDPARVRLAGLMLRRKRVRTVAKVWPALPQTLGERFAGEFLLYAESHALPAGGAKEDGLAFAREVGRKGLLPWRLRWRLLLFRWLRPFRTGR